MTQSDGEPVGEPDARDRLAKEASRPARGDAVLLSRGISVRDYSVAFPVSRFLLFPFSAFSCCRLA